MTDTIGDLDVAALRRRRDELRTTETAVSYRRRLLQAQLDIVVAIDLGGSDELVRRLTAAMADHWPVPPGAPRAVATAVDLAGPDALPADLAALTRSERAALADRIATDERALSARRRGLLDELDEIQEELVRRYRDGGVDPRALLTEV